MWTIFKVFTELVTILLLFYVLFFGHAACGILSPQPAIEPAPPALEGKVFNHWTDREVPLASTFRAQYRMLTLVTCYLCYKT